VILIHGRYKSAAQTYPRNRKASGDSFKARYGWWLFCTSTHTSNRRFTFRLILCVSWCAKPGSLGFPIIATGTVLSTTIIHAALSRIADEMTLGLVLGPLVLVLLSCATVIAIFRLLYPAPPHLWKARLNKASTTSPWLTKPLGCFCRSKILKSIRRKVLNASATVQLHEGFEVIRRGKPRDCSSSPAQSLRHVNDLSVHRRVGTL
jgi:hypothetical protein